MKKINNLFEGRSVLGELTPTPAHQLQHPEGGRVVLGRRRGKRK